MPLIKGKSQKAFVHNLKTEMEHGHPQKQSLAIAYAMKRKAQKKMAEGGSVPQPSPSPQKKETPQEEFARKFREGSGFSHGGKVDRSETANQIRNERNERGRVNPAKGSAEKGIHHQKGRGLNGEYAPQGQSEAGANLRYGLKTSAKLIHQKVREQASKIHPNLKGLAHGGKVKGVHETAYEHEKPKDKIEKSLAGESMAGSYVRDAIHYADIHGDKGGSGKKHAEILDKAKAEHHKKLGEMQAMKKPKLKGLAHGGFINEEKASGYLDMPEEHDIMNYAAMMEDDKDLNQHMVHAEDSHEEDLVDRIMHKRNPDFSGLARLSQGGQVANETPIKAGFMPNEFDYLVLNDGLESHYGDDDNSGDALGNEQEDEDRHDIIARIMASRKKKDKNPNPA